MINERTAILKRIRQHDLDPEFWKEIATSARCNINDGKRLAKLRWTHFLAEKNYNLLDSPKEAWKSINLLKEQIHSHYKTPDIMRFQLSDTISLLADEKIWKHFQNISQDFTIAK